MAFRKRTVGKKRHVWTLLSALVALACSGENFASGPENKNLGKDGGQGGANQSSSGGAASTGGRTGSSGSQSSGGATAAGGATTSGGVPGSGGVQSSGGAGGVGTGGAVGTGGNNQTGGSSGVSDAGAPKLCGSAGATFPTFVKGCTTTANCALVKHQTDCCGSRLVMAVNHGELTRFDDAEKICESEYPLCGCVSQGVQAEDGTTVPADRESAIVAECSGGSCRSRYGGKTFACGPKTCTDLQYCSVTTGGALGSLPTYNCVPMGNCTSCACLPNSGSCTCLVAAVGNTVTCKAP